MRSLRCVLAAAVLCAGLAGPAAAQARIGLQLGPTWSTLSDPTVEDISARSTVAGGGYLVLPFGSRFSLQPELMYMNKGATADFTDEIGTVGIFRLEYMQIPILFRNSFGRGRLRPTAFIGPAFSFMMKCSLEAPGLLDEPANCDDESTDAAIINTTDFSGILGLGLDYSAGLVVVSVDGRYEFGFKDIDTSPGAVKNRSWTLLIGASIPLERQR